MRIQAKNVSIELAELLQNKKEYAVHSCFESGFNIKINKFLCFIGNRQNTKLPYGILLKEQCIPSLVGLIGDRNTGFVWNNEKRQFETEEIVIELGEAGYFSSFLNEKPHRISEDYADLFRDNIDMNIKTGFGLSLLQLIREENAEKNRLYLSFNSKDKEFIKSVLLKWIGCGAGLTPAGDDFLIGILFIHKICHILNHEFLEQLKELIKEEKYTTDISMHYYMSAFENCYNDALLDLYQALISADEKLMRISIDKVLQFGHTSGCDMIAGVLTGLIYGLEHHKLG